MSLTLLIATRNRHKLREFQTMLAADRVAVISLDDVSFTEEIKEDGLTFADNARKKACLTAKATGQICLADDSGLVVPALNGQPGVYSARFAGEKATDNDNNKKLLSLLKGCNGNTRYGEFVSVIAISDPLGNVQSAEGVCSGLIAYEPAGYNGFGYDPLFIPVGYTCTFAQLTEDEKNRISHRSQALKKARELLKKYDAENR